MVASKVNMCYACNIEPRDKKSRFCSLCQVDLDLIRQELRYEKHHNPFAEEENIDEEEY